MVIKYGGAAMVKSPERTIRDVALLKACGEGSGDYRTASCAKIKP